MGLFKTIAVPDLKLRLVLLAATVAGAAISFPLMFVFEFRYGLEAGLLVGSLVAYVTAKQLS